MHARQVLSAHAASMGDTLLGVPLSVAAGLMTEGVYTLQVGPLVPAAPDTARAGSGASIGDGVLVARVLSC